MFPARAPPAAPHSPPPHPSIVDHAVDLALDDDGLSTLEKIYLFSRSKASFHRVFIAHALPLFLDQVSPQEAVEYVLPLLSGLAMDDDEQVKEALAAELVSVIWWFFTHCQVTPDDLSHEDTMYPSSSIPTTISVQAFTPILGTLLLSPNGLVGGVTRYAVVDLLSRMKMADAQETNIEFPSRALHETRDAGQDNTDIITGLFGPEERAMFQREILQQVVIGMGRLDADVEAEPEQSEFGSEEVAFPQGNRMALSHPNGADENTLERYIPSPDSVISAPSYAELTSSSSITSAASIDSTSTHNAVDFHWKPSLSAPSLQTYPLDSMSTPYWETITADHLDSKIFSQSGSGSASDSASPAMDIKYSEGLLPLAIQRNDEIDVEPLSNGSFLLTSQSNDATLSPLKYPLFGERSLPLDFSTVESPTSATSSGTGRVSERSNFRTEENESEINTDGGYEAYVEPIYVGSIDESDEGDGEQAAVGRLSSMSLMAAVTASGSLDEDTKQAFVHEVERVGRDSVYWVRREASFALGALAKVVPEEVVHCSLVPLFDSLRWDPVWHVRHSALFALPAILSRLSPQRRRMLALETICMLAVDDSATVRSGVLEGLGEVLYTFHQDSDGPPEELVQLFLGRKEDKRVRDGQQELSMTPSHTAEALSPLMGSPKFILTRSPQQPSPEPDKASNLESFYKDPERPHICAFNYPAVAFTLGRKRWGDIREAYLEIAANRSLKVRRTLAASLGELAKIIGEENAQRDLIDIWWDFIRSKEEEVRLKAMEIVDVFVLALGKVARGKIMYELLSMLDEGILEGWRERQCIAKALVDLARAIVEEAPSVIIRLLKRTLEDNVAAVRETAVAGLPQIWIFFSARTDALADLQANLRSLSQSDFHRKRMTFIACQQALALPSQDDAPAVSADDDFWKSIASLADDAIIGVRIGVARLAGTICDKLLQESQSIPATLVDLVWRLSKDVSQEVQSYVPDPLCLHHGPHGDVRRQLQTMNNRSWKQPPNMSIFSRPPSHRTKTQSISAVDASCDGVLNTERVSERETVDEDWNRQKASARADQRERDVEEITSGHKKPLNMIDLRI